MSTRALMTDLYQLTMGAGYFKHAEHEKRMSFELFVRRLPPDRRSLVFRGLEAVLGYLRELRFTESQIAYLREVPGLRSAMSFDFIEFLRDFRFRGDVTAMPEGTVFFANEPLLRVTGTLFEAQLVETFLLSAINTESMVASKAARIVRAAGPASVLEFGTRRTSDRHLRRRHRAGPFARQPDARRRIQVGARSRCGSSGREVLAKQSVAPRHPPSVSPSARRESGERHHRHARRVSRRQHAAA